MVEIQTIDVVKNILYIAAFPMKHETNLFGYESIQFEMHWSNWSRKLKLSRFQNYSRSDFHSEY